MCHWHASESHLPQCQGPYDQQLVGWPNSEISRNFLGILHFKRDTYGNSRAPLLGLSISMHQKNPRMSWFLPQHTIMDLVPCSQNPQQSLAGRSQLTKTPMKASGCSKWAVSSWRCQGFLVFSINIYCISFTVKPLTAWHLVRHQVAWSRFHIFAILSGSPNSAIAPNALWTSDIQGENKKNSGGTVVFNEKGRVFTKKCCTITSYPYFPKRKSAPKSGQLRWYTNHLPNLYHEPRALHQRWFQSSFPAFQV